MKTYTITFRHSTVVDTITVSASNAKKAKKIATRRIDWPQARVYIMQRVA